MTKKIALLTVACLAATMTIVSTASAWPTLGHAAPSTKVCDATVRRPVHQDPGRRPDPFVSASGLAHAGDRASRGFEGALQIDVSIRGSVGASASMVRSSDSAADFARATTAHGGEVSL